MLEPIFQMDLHKRDHNLLLHFKNSLGGIGKVRYYISTKDNLKELILYLDSYPLGSQKYADYILFKSIVELIQTKSHLNKEGFNKIISFKASLNLGLSSTLNSVFPHITPSERPTVNTKNIPNPN